MDQAIHTTGSRRRRAIAIALIAATVLIAIGVIGWRAATRLPKRFATVIDGSLYRSGEVSPGQLQTLSREYGVRSVLSLLDPNDPESQSEKAAAERLGIHWVNIPLRGNGASTPEQRNEMRRILLAEPLDGPMLVHCAAGTNRTGLACGMVRLHRQGWTLDQVMAEMKRFDFEDLDKHENLRDALREEADIAAVARAIMEQAQAASSPAVGSPGDSPERAAPPPESVGTP